MPLTARRLSLTGKSLVNADAPPPGRSQGGARPLGGQRRRHRASSREALLDVALDQRVELGGDVVAAQGERLLAVDEDRRRRRLAGAGQADADVGVLALA